MAFFEEVWAKSVDCGFTRGRGICPSSVGKEGESVKWRLPRVHRGSGLARLSRRPKTDIADRRDAISRFFCCCEGWVKRVGDV